MFDRERRERSDSLRYSRDKECLSFISVEMSRVRTMTRALQNKICYCCGVSGLVCTLNTKCRKEKYCQLLLITVRQSLLSSILYYTASFEKDKISMKYYELLSREQDDVTI